ncbi:hypothetical protein QEZ52_05280 [Aliisedimentitalea scapharcae]|uniref:Sulfotransferase family protein n=1 Tax=Aliisedimentitalea scapharcae TaxID=1524259 RepID=A0ABZ2XV18_9RHOB
MQIARDTESCATWQALGLTPGLVLRLSGMRRSGNHAIANWLMRNAPTGTSVFLNNCKPNRDPLQHFSALEVNRHHVAGGDAAGDLPSRVAKAGDGALLLISYEDTSPAEMKRHRRLSGPLDEAAIDHDILIYRSFLNWSASLLKKLQGNPSYSLSRRLSMVLRAMDNYTRLLALVARGQGAETCICYDTWVQSASYRQDILVRLNLPVADTDVGEVQKYGGGSSFQKQSASGDELRVLDRWHQMQTEPDYQLVLAAAGRDAALMAQLDRLFPEDAERLTQIARHAPVSPGDLT